MQKLSLIFCISLTLFPTLTRAAVMINEVAWMGDLESANHEWIELFNSGDSSVNLDGWTISDGLNLNINLSGQLRAGSYGVLERSSEESAPGLAFLIYTGALINTGATLTLKNEAGSIMDQVPGGDGWEKIGGDNVTKETAQYTEKGWVTDTPTPGQVNATGRTVSSEVANSNQSSTKVGSKIMQPSRLASSQTILTRDNDSGLVLSPEVRKVAYVNQTIPFDVVASGIGRSLIASLNYTWNFGDSYAKGGKAVEHYYEYPGEYVVSVQATFSDIEAEVSETITVLPVSLSLFKNEQGDIQINNNAPYDIDISGYELMGVNKVTMPQRTVLLVKGTITIGHERLGAYASDVISLWDVSKNQVASTKSVYKTELQNERITSYTVVPSNKSFVEEALPANELESNQFNFVDSKTDLGASKVESESPSEVANTKEPEEIIVPPSQSEEENKNWPYLAFIALLLFGFVGIVYSKPSKVV